MRNLRTAEDEELRGLSLKGVQSRAVNVTVFGGPAAHPSTSQACRRGPVLEIETKRGNNMRYITALKVAALALGLGGAAITCQAQPGGSYRQTCRDVSVRGSTLYATCQDQGGNWRNTQLSDFDRCNGEIQNLNGNLSCSGGNGYGPGDRRDGDRRDGDNRYGDNRDRDRDHDRDGDRDRNGYNGPPGSYSQTCSNIQVNGNTLQATCQKRNGKTKNTSLRNFRDCRDIQNDNGKLRCTR
jgi:hypothetical protein